jgi:hypothetical protein
MQITFRPVRTLYLLVVSVVAYYYLGLGGVVAVVFGQMDITPNRNNAA